MAIKEMMKQRPHVSLLQLHLDPLVMVACRMHPKNRATTKTQAKSLLKRVPWQPKPVPMNNSFPAAIVAVSFGALVASVVDGIHAAAVETGGADDVFVGAG